MSLGSQAANVELMAQLTGLTHDIFVGEVENLVRRESPAAMLFEDAQPGQYKLVGQNMKFAVDLRFKTGAMATDGKIPDHVGLDAQQGEVVPIRRYERIALDNFVEMRASGEGSFEDLGDRIFDHLWDAWRSMEIRHAIGASSGLVCKVGARSSSTAFTVKDGYGRADTDPLSNLSEGSIICWYDVSGSAVGGAARITSSGINYSSLQITVDSAATWEPSATLAADDLIYFASTNSLSNAHFVGERNLAPNGLGTIIDPSGAATTVHGISETTYGRWKPYRQASITWDHLELTEHWRQLGAKRGFGVTPERDVVLTFPSAVSQMARSLMALQQQAYVGEELNGGYTGVRVSGIKLLEDSFFYQDVAMTLCKEKLFRIPLGGQADFWGEDGSKWSRIADYDGKSAYVVDYLNFMSNHRGAHGALTGIVTSLTDANYTNIPNY